MLSEPEIYSLKRSVFAPNSNKPVLVYRDCLPLPVGEENSRSFLESHAWLYDGTWGHVSWRHFHPNTHECYGIFDGQSTLLLGCGRHDDADKSGLEVDIFKGDVIVIPAGVGHCNLRSSQRFRYIAVYPRGSPKYRNELGKERSNIDELESEAEAVALPEQDPVYGVDGPLLRLWST